MRAGLLAVAALLIAAVCPGTAEAQPVKGTANLSVAGGYARLVVKLDEDVETEVSVAGNILVVRFKRPVDLDIGKLGDAAPEYIGSARRDPDGAAIRFALQRKVTVNTMAAGERTFVDLLPDTWSGLPPGLPQEVVRELAERARMAERALRQQRATAEARKRPPVRVRASVQPTFVRYTFEMPDGVGVSSSLNEQKLTLSFGAPLTFDLADAKLAAPPNVGAIVQDTEGSNASIAFSLIGDVDVRSFREDKAYIVDIVFQQPEKPPQLAKPAAVAAPPPSASAVTPKSAMIEIPAATVADAITPPTSDSIAQQVRQDTAPAPKAAPVAIVETQAAAAVKPPAPPPVIAVAAQIPPPGDAPATGKAAMVSAKRSSDGLRVTFSFLTPTPAALFRRADVMWLVLDSVAPIDLAPIRREGASLIGDVSMLPLDKGQAIRMRLNRPQLASLTAVEQKDGGQGWTLTFADTLQSASQSLDAVRNLLDPAHANIVVPMAGAGLLHRVVDPDVGDSFVVATAPPPVRGFIRRQQFIEFTLPESIQGMVVQANADDLAIEVISDKVMLSRPGGLTLSPSSVGRMRAATPVKSIFDPNRWAEDQRGTYRERYDALVAALANAPAIERVAARTDLARFYFARGLYVEAKGALDAVLDNDSSDRDDPQALIMRAVASTLVGRPALAMKDLADPAAIGPNYDVQLWKALALAQQGKWADAREKFKNAGFAISALPTELQQIALAQAMRASLEVKDFADAASRRSELELVGIPAAMMPQVLVMRGRLAEALGRDKDALADYAMAAESSNAPAAAESKVSMIALRQKRDEISPEDATRELETLTMTWRGGDVEVRTLQLLAKLYGDSNRYGEALAAARRATLLQANSETSRQLQDDAAALFAQIFLSPKGDDIPPIEALGTFYEHRELTPIGRRGDEMIRRLAERLVAVDLLEQASELLQYQVDHRLEGAARAQVAGRLAMVYLMNRKPERAIAALRGTRISDLAGELRQQRLLLEARAQSDIGRRDLALDIISNLGGREALRLRSDIYWGARRWREASEQIELYYGERWRDFTPLNSAEKGDVIRAVIGYALAEDGLGLARFREKYAPLMSGIADRAAFETASKPASTNSAEFAGIAKMAASVDTLDGFLREMKSRFPDTVAKAPLPPETPKADPVTTGSLPQIVGLKQQRVEARR